MIGKLTQSRMYKVDAALQAEPAAYSVYARALAAYIAAIAGSDRAAEDAALDVVCAARATWHGIKGTALSP